MVFQNILSAACGLYLAERDGQSNQFPKGKDLEQLSRAQKASLELASSLEALNDRTNITLGISDESVSRREDFQRDYGEDSDTYKILSNIFPLNVSGRGFRQSGLQLSFKVLAEFLASVQENQIQNRKKGVSMC